MSPAHPVLAGRRATKSSSSARSRPRASVACVSCRQKKTKCNAQNLEPGKSCSMCENSNTECVVIRNSDRRKHGSREHITTLQERMESLEAIISRCGVNFQDARKQDANNIALQSPSTTPTDSSQQGLGLVTEENDEVVDNVDPDLDLVGIDDVHDEEAFDDIQIPGPDPEDNHHQLSPETHSEFIVPLSPTAQRSERRLSRLDAEAPSLDADSSPGQVRYYGPTTQLHIQSPANLNTSGPIDTNTTFDFIIDIDSPQLRDVLIHSCWNHYSRSVNVVDKDIFMAHRASGRRSQYYSNFLEVSLLACATRISTSQAVRKLGRAYVDRAKQTLAHELEQPTIATLQGFLLLSDFEATAARDRVGWTYSGIACRLIFDLGLHEDCSQLVKHGILTHSDIEIRDRLFLAAFVYDRLWALYLGRPCCVPAGILQQREFLKEMDNENTLFHWVDLCKYISEVTDILNGFGTCLDETAASRLSDLGNRISIAHDNLPPRLSSRHISELHVTAYGLNMQFCGIQIVLHRALIKIHSQSSGDTSSETVETSRQIMYKNTACICRLSLAYREIFGVENFITVMLDNMYIAASTLISQIIQPPIGQTTETSFPDAIQLLNIVSKTIKSLQDHYPVAEKMRRTLSRITENTTLAGTFGSDCNPNAALARGSQGLSLDSLMPPLGGSWGSMEALVHDDFILSHSSVLGGDFQTVAGLPDSTWIQDMNLDFMP